MSSHTFHHLHHVPSNCFPALHRKHQEVSNFLHFSKMPLQSTCFQIQFYLCAVLSSLQSRTPLSISRHFAIGRKFLLKASFYTLFPVLHYLSSYTTITESKCILSQFSILLSFFHSEKKKPIFEFKLTCNWILFKLYGRLFSSSSSSSTIAKQTTVLFFPTPFQNICHSCHSHPAAVAALLQ